MPTYEISAPNGKTYRIQGPAGASDAQVRAEVLRQFPEAGKASAPRPKRAPSLLEQFGAAAKNTVAGLVEGAAALPDTAAQALGRGAASLFRDEQANAPANVAARSRGGATGVMDKIRSYTAAPLQWVPGAEEIAAGLSNPQTVGGVVKKVAPVPTDAAGRTVRTISQNVGGTMATMGGGTLAQQFNSPVAQKVGQALTAAPVAQMTAATTAGGSSSLAREMGASEPVQAAAGLVGGVTGGLAADRLSRITQAARTPVAPPQVLDDAEQAGVRVMTSDVVPPKTFAGRWAQSAGEKIPVAGTGPVRAAQEEQRIAAIQNLLDDYGVDDAAKAADDIMQNLSAKRSADLTRLTAAKKNVINSIPGTVPVNRTTQAIDDEIALLKSLKSKGYQPVIDTLEDWKQAIQGQDLKNIELLRKQFGNSFKAPELAAIRATGEEALSRTYNPLREDMGEFIKTRAGNDAFSTWKSANDSLSQMAGDLKVSAFKSVLQKGDATPEVVERMLFSQKPSEVRQLYNSLTERGRANARTAILARAFAKAEGKDGISPEKFSSEIGRLGKTIGVFFTGDELKRIEGLKRVLDVTRRASQASANPPTGQQLAIPVGAAVLTDLFGTAGSALATGASVGLLARVYESAPVRNLLLSVARSKPGSPQQAVLVGRAIEAINDAKASLPSAMNALNDNVGMRVSAGEAEEQQDSEQPAL